MAGRCEVYFFLNRTVKKKDCMVFSLSRYPSLFLRQYSCLKSEFYFKFPFRDGELTTSEMADGSLVNVDTLLGSISSPSFLSRFQILFKSYFGTLALSSEPRKEVKSYLNPIIFLFLHGHELIFQQ